MLEKMGWSKGKGLGAKEDGVTANIKLPQQLGQEGLGWTDKDNYVELATDYEKVLAQLNSKHRSNLNSEAESSPSQSSQEDKETKPKVLKVRHRYSKVQRAKDVSRYSKEDMAKIFAVKVEDLTDSGHVMLREEGDDFVNSREYLNLQSSFALPLKQEDEALEMPAKKPKNKNKEKKLKQESQDFKSVGYSYFESTNETPIISLIKKEEEKLEDATPEVVIKKRKNRRHQQLEASSEPITQTSKRKKSQKGLTEAVI